MSWIEKRSEFQKRFDELSQENIQAIITELNKAISNYVSKGGLSQDPNNNPDYNNILNLTQKAESIKERYSKLNDDIINYLKDNAKDTDMASLLTENGELLKQINRLEKIKSEIKIDVDSAIARDELLRSRDTEVSRHQLFLLGKPIRKGLIPYLWIISILFIGVTLVIFKITAPSLGFGGPSITGESSIFAIIIGFITNKIVLGSLLVSSLIVIIFLSLKIAGVFGK
jgi:hypothetical protein